MNAPTMRFVRTLLLLAIAVSGGCHATHPPGEALLRMLAAEPARAARIAPRAESIVGNEAGRTPSLGKATAVLLPTRPVSAKNEILRTWAALFGTRRFASEVGASRAGVDGASHDEERLAERVARRLRL